MFKYLKFLAAPLTILIAIYFSFLGGNYVWYFFLGFYAFVMITGVYLFQVLNIESQLKDDSTLAGHPTDPGRFGWEELEARKESIGRSTFNLQFLLDISLSDEEKYPLKLQDLCIFRLNRTMGPDRVVWSANGDKALDLPSVGLHGDLFYKPGQ